MAFTHFGGCRFDFYEYDDTGRPIFRITDANDNTIEITEEAYYKFAEFYEPRRWSKVKAELDKLSKL